MSEEKKDIKLHDKQKEALEAVSEAIKALAELEYAADDDIATADELSDLICDITAEHLGMDGDEKPEEGEEAVEEPEDSQEEQEEEKSEEAGE